MIPSINGLFAFEFHMQHKYGRLKMLMS